MDKKRRRFYIFLKSQKSLLVFFNFISCIMLLVFALIIFQQAKKSENYDAWVVHSYEVLSVAHQIGNGASKIESSYRGYFLTGAPEFLRSVSMVEAHVHKSFDHLQKLIVNSPEQGASIEKIQRVFIAFKALQEQQKRIYIMKGASGLMIGDILLSQQIMDQLQGLLGNFITIELQHLNRRIVVEKMENEYHSSTIITGTTISIVVLIIANALIMLLMSSSAKTARRLQDMEELYRLVMESMSDGLFDFNPQTKEIIFSPSYRRQLGYTEEEMPNRLEKGFDEIVHPDDHDRVLMEVDNYLEKKIPNYSIAYRLRHKDGHWMWILSRAMGIWDKNGQAVRMVGIHTDITSQKVQEEALRELNAELESFTYIASHDLRSPLVNLKGFAKEIEGSLGKIKETYHLFADKLSEEEKLKILAGLETDIPESIGFINSAVERMDMLTGAILNLSRIGRRVYRPSMIDVNELVKRCLSSINHDINNANAKIETKDLPGIYADQVAIEQIFSNLIDNAVKYLDPTRPGKIIIEGMEQDNNIIYTIQDNGRGIDEQDRTRIFDIFRRARNSGSVRGVGMGLAFVRTTIRKMGGKIWFESVPDKGTTFYVSLPKDFTSAEGRV